MQAVLVMFRSDGERRSFSVTRNITVVGRREDSDLRIPHGDVSRKHCRIIKDDDGMRLEDLGSSNGTYHNGTRVNKDTVVQPGDSIQVGPVVFVLQVDGVPADEDLHPITVESAAGDGGQMAAMDEAPSMPVPPPMPPVMPTMGGPPPVPVPPPMPAVAGGDGGDESLEELQPLEDLEPIAAAEGEGGVEELEAIPLDEEPLAAAAHPPPLDAHAHEGHAAGHGQEDGGFEIVDESHAHDDAIPLDHIDMDAEQPHGRA